MPTKKKKAAKSKKSLKNRLTTRKKKPIRRASRKPIRKKVIKRKPAAKKIAVKKPVAKKQAPKKKFKAKPKAPKIAGQVLGKVTHYFPHVNAAVIKLEAPLNINDVIRVKGHTTDLQETVTSIQIDRVPVTETKKGDEIGFLVKSRVRAGDIVYKI